MPKFSPGDVVILKSGGKSMTIEKYHDTTQVICIYEKGGEIKKEFIEEVALEKYVPATISFTPSRRNNHY